MIDELVDKARKKKCVRVNLLQDDMEYGSYEDLDEMVDSANVKDRVRIASLGYGLNKLKDDVDPEVRQVALSKLSRVS